MQALNNSDRNVSLLLMAASTVGSLWLACVTPFPALAVAAAYALSPRAAALTALGTWVANQAIGFGFLSYPVDANTILWGLSIGIAATISAGLASTAIRRASTNAVVALATACVVAFAAYEVLLFAASVVLGGADGFTPSIVGQYALLNLGWVAGLVGTLEIGRRGARLLARA